MLKTLKEVKAADSVDFFSPEAVKLFKSTTLAKVYPVKGGAIFITGEMTDGDLRSPAPVRRYTVRLMHDSGQVDNVSTYLEFRTTFAAHARAAKEAADLNA